MEIYKTLIIPVICSKDNYEYLKGCNKESAKVWNMCIELDTKHRENNDNKWLSQNQLQKMTKGNFKLHSKGVQHIVGKYLYARESALKVKKENLSKNAKYPYRIKKYFVTGWDYQSIKVNYEKGEIELSKPDIIDENGIKRRSKRVKCYAKTIPQNIVQIELKYYDKFYLCIKYKEISKRLDIQSSNHAAIDLGEIHSITSIDTSGNAIIITGRKLRAIKQLRNKHQAELYKKITKCTKGSRQYWKYRNAMNKLSVKFQRKMNDCIHKTTKLYLDYCILNNIKTVYYGDLDSAIRNTKKNKKANNFVRQKLSQWNFGLIIRQLENKLSRYEINLIKVDEYYTSQTCPSCKERHKPRNRQFICACGYKQHRDLVGSINILNQNANTTIIKYSNLKYLQIA